MSDATEKKTSAINFRVPDSFRNKVTALETDTGWTASDIARFGLVAFWPEIDVLVRASGPVPSSDSKHIREFIDLCRAAQARGLDPKRVMTDALEAKLHGEAVV